MRIQGDKPGQRLLTTAQAFVVSRNSSSINSRQICEEAETSASQLHSYFQNQEGLLVAVFEQGWQFVQIELLTHLLKPSRNFVDTFIAVLEAVLDGWTKHPDAVSAMIIVGFDYSWGPADKNPLGQSSMVKHLEQLKALLADEVEPELLEDAAQMIFGAVSLFFRHRATDPDRATLLASPQASLQSLRRLFEGVMADRQLALPLT